MLGLLRKPQRPLFSKVLRLSILPVTLASFSAGLRSFSTLESSELNGSNGFRFNVGNEGKPRVKFYQYQVCPFCNKAKSVIALSGIPLKEIEFIEVNPMKKKEIAFSEYKKVPLMVVEDTSGATQQINDSNEIINFFVETANIKETSESVKWRKWLDSEVAPLLPMTLHGTFLDAYNAFDYIMSQSNFGTFEKYYLRIAGAGVMTVIAKRNMKKKGIDNPSEKLVECLEKFATEGLPELSSTEGDIGKYAVFGMISVLDGNYKIWDHLRNSNFHNKEKFWEWYSEMKAQRDSV